MKDFKRGRGWLKTILCRARLYWHILKMAAVFLGHLYFSWTQIQLMESSGLNPINKKILRIWTKFSDFWKFPQISKLCSYQNILRTISWNLSSQVHKNILSENFSAFLKKLVGFKNSQIFVIKFLRTQIFV